MGYKQEMGRLAKKYDTSKANAQRLLKTEIARINADTQLAMLKDNGFTHMIYVAEPGACDICGPLDKKAIPIDKVEKGVNMFPMHPNCRCSAYGHIKMEYKGGGSTLDDYEAWEDKGTKSVPEKTDVFTLSKDMQKTLYDYTNGEFQEICDYSQYITDEKQFKSTYLWHGENGQLRKITDNTKADVKAIHELINKQPLEKDKLIRFEKLRSGDYSDYLVGDTLNFGIRSATRDKEFIEKLEQDRVVGFETKKRGLNSRKNVKFIFNSSKSLDVSNISEYPDQLEELIQGSYKIVDTKFVKGKNEGWEYIDMPMTQYVEENNLKTEIRTSKKGNKNIVIHMPTGKERLYPLEKWESGTVRYTEEFYNREEKMERLEVYLEYVNDKK